MEHRAAPPAPAAEHTTDRSMADFRAATSDQWRHSVLAGEVSCVELTSTALTAAAAMSSLGAFLHLDPEYALARASLLDDTLAGLRRMLGTTATGELSARAPLLGLPTAFKDLVPVAGLPLTLGTLALPVQVPARDAPLAARVHHAGAVSIGKTQVPEFGLHCYAENQVGPPARNPLDVTRTAGGSTGGGAAAVAAGILPFAPANDGGGSTRIPAAACGMVGLKPGRGRLPDDDANDAVTNLPVSGPIADRAEDAALLFDVMAGHRFTTAEPSAGGETAIATGRAQRFVHSALQGRLPQLSIGVTTESPFSPEVDVVLDEQAMAAVETAIASLGSAGHLIQGTSHCTGADSFWPANYFSHFTTLWTPRLAQFGFNEEQRAGLEPLTRHYLELAEARPAQETFSAIESLQAVADEAEAIFGPWDLILTPMLGFAPPKVGWFDAMDPEENYRQQCRFTPYSAVVNVLGLPAVSVPVHTDREGLSWSVQLIGKRGSEELLLGLAALLMHG